MTERTPRPDYSRLDVPSQHLSPEVIRSANPQSHSGFAPLLKSQSFDAVRTAMYAAMRHQEQAVISKAFAGALGRSDPSPHMTRDELIQGLAEIYQIYGLATGPQHTEQLVRDLESRSVAQAQAIRGTGRG